MSRTLAFTIGDPSQIAEARRAAVALAAGLGFTETEAGRVAIVATEMARNLVAHATRSRQFLLRALRESAWGGSGSPAPAGVEMIALDKGPGIANIAQCMRDGHSSAGTPGTGLGAIFRLAGVCDIHSVRDAGTALLAQVWRTPGPPPREPGWTEVGAACVPKPRETHNGDNWAVRRESGRTVLLVADGLGHGQFAAAASDAAVAAFEAHPGLPPAGIIEVVHAALRSTRGAAVGALEMDPTKGVARFAGVGNIAGTILTEDQRKALVSHNGTAGGEIRRIEEFRYPWLKDAVAVVHSDGLSGRGGPDDYPGLSAKHPGIIAGVLYRDLARGTDDVTVVVAKGSSVG